MREDHLKAIVAKFEGIETALANTAESEEIVRLSRERAQLEPLVSVIRARGTALSEREGLEAILDDASTDDEMGELAAAEAEELDARLEDLDQQLKVLLLPRDDADDNSAIVEIRAGTGGEEAALFAGDLARMYQRYAEDHGWSVSVLSASETGLGGYKELILDVSGQGVYARLKFESGVHRVQRVPETEGGGRIHTSAATVAVLPQAQDVDVEIRQEDIRIDTMRASGAGGQHVNTTDSAVRITHLPTGIVVTSSEKSQHQNRAQAMKVLRARLFEMERERQDSERSAARKSQVGTGDRSERIRTYNFPQGRVTDHRINLTLYKLDQILSGEALDEVIDALVSEDQAQRLAAAEASEVMPSA
ncbi:MAG: peptide chain release factor 1 [Rhodobiaceae bacterium]|nr:peptide chain release factor 1 [Rhodobiaceae bacterium]MCC0018580.1 peptide chain release factor 1 [Rhodobiaceae bacterium]MCC0062174.1 peptide chain release factor 1 [Rhodobiaceae bacterium]